jgi:hypothetical protein
MASNLELARDTKCNKEFERKSGWGNLGPEQIMPAGLSLVFGVVISIILNLDYIGLTVSVICPFGGYTAAVGNDPKRFYSQWSKTPKWRKSAARHEHYFQKSIVGQIRK